MVLVSKAKLEHITQTAILLLSVLAVAGEFNSSPDPFSQKDENRDLSKSNLLSLLKHAPSYTACNILVKGWANRQLHLDRARTARSAGNRLSSSLLNCSRQGFLPDLLLFLHVPRTGGRTFQQCVLRPHFSKEERCPYSYYMLQPNPRALSKCKLLASHSDWSLLQTVPETRQPAVVLTLRHPVQRTTSFYWFAMETAARSILKKGLETVQTHNVLLGPKDLRNETEKVPTQSVWPWSRLVPLLEEEMLQGSVNGSLRPMALDKFLEHPLVEDVTHNAATLQVAGLTETSSDPEAPAVRKCVKQYQGLGQYVLELAKDRVSNAFFVGLTEEHEESAWLLAIKLEKHFEHNATSLEQYRSCVNKYQGICQRASTRAALTLPPNYKDEKPPNIQIVEAILKHNWLDSQLYEHARTVYNNQKSSLMELIRVEKNVAPGGVAYDKTSLEQTRRFEMQGSEIGLLRGFVRADTLAVSQHGDEL